MGSTSDRIKGLANEVAGKAKRATAEVIGDADLQAEGLAQEARGKRQQADADVKDVPADVPNRTANEPDRTT
jgi:uncharacterized protein YjbJ (UPF0337 family)